MKIYYFSYNKNAPSARYRGRYLLEKIKQKYKIPYYIFAPDYEYMPLLILLLISVWLKKNKRDIFIFQKICDDTLYSKMLLKMTSLTQHSIYDIDDAMYYIKKNTTINKFIKSVNTVTVGSESLKKYCSKINKNTILLTTSLPKSTLLKKRKNKLFTIGWIGIYKVHKENLFTILFPAITQLSHPIQLTLLGVSLKEQKDVTRYFKKNKNIRLNIPQNINWDNENEINTHISSFDIGVMPLLDTGMNRGKSAFKIKQYLNCGVPVIASPVGENVKYVSNDINGFLCSVSQEWYKKILFFYTLPNQQFQKYIQNSIDSYLKGDFNENATLNKLSKILKL